MVYYHQQLPDYKHEGSSQIEVEVQNVDENDLQAVLDWARGICNGVTVEEAATLLNTGRTIDAVVGSLTDRLPDGTRDAAAQVCEEGLRSSGAGTVQESSPIPRRN
jgi:hypothetical protein